MHQGNYAAWVYSELHGKSTYNKLSKITDGLLHSVSDCRNEMNECIQALNVVCDTLRSMRATLHNESFENWCKLKYQGSGAIHFKNHTLGNDFEYNENSLSSSEWVAAIKLSTNYANFNGVPGVASSSNLYRKCGMENETIAHVTGSCPSNNLLITARHHSTKHNLTELLRSKEFTCFEEVYAIDNYGSTRFSDIIAFQPNSKNAYIIDPTIRYESNDANQDQSIKEEKYNIYSKCIPFYKE